MMVYLVTKIAIRPWTRLESRDVMDQHGHAREDPVMNDSAPELESENEDSATEKGGDECAAAESEWTRQCLLAR